MGPLETRKFISEYESSSQKLHCNVYIMQATFTPMVGHLQLHLKRYLIPRKSKILSSILMFSWFISLYSLAKVAINQITTQYCLFLQTLGFPRVLDCLVCDDGNTIRIVLSLWLSNITKYTIKTVKVSFLPLSNMCVAVPNYSEGVKWNDSESRYWLIWKIEMIYKRISTEYK